MCSNIKRGAGHSTDWARDSGKNSGQGALRAKAVAPRSFATVLRDNQRNDRRPRQATVQLKDTCFEEYDTWDAINIAVTSEKALKSSVSRFRACNLMRALSLVTQQTKLVRCASESTGSS